MSEFDLKPILVMFTEVMDPDRAEKIVSEIMDDYLIVLFDGEPDVDKKRCSNQFYLLRELRDTLRQCRM